MNANRKKLGERLIDSGLITAEALKQALSHQRITGHKLGDCLVEIGLLQEVPLLRFLAAEFGTRFVTSEKLSQAKIPMEVLDRLPVRMAEQQLVLPLAWDAEREALSVVMADPQSEPLLREIALVTSAEEVHAFIAVRATIAAGIRKFYYGDPTAFLPADPMVSSARADGREPTGSAVGPTMMRAANTRNGSRQQRGVVGSAGSTQLRDLLGAIRGALGDDDYIQTLHVLVGMLEGQHEGHSGHSAVLARHAGEVAQRLGLSSRELTHVAIAAYLHQLGKPAGTHFTLGSNAVSPEQKAAAADHCLAPMALFRAVNLPLQVNTILGDLYEAWDGSGVPRGVRGEHIAPGARVLAAVDAWLDLIHNPANAAGRLLSRAEALAELSASAGRLYDPAVVALLARLQNGDLLRQRLACDGRVILVAEPDATVRMAVVHALEEIGWVAHGVPSLSGVAEAVLRGAADMLVVALRFGGEDLLALTRFLRSRPECAGIPIAVLGEPDPLARAQLEQNGASTFIPLPLDPGSAIEPLNALAVQRILEGGPAREVTGAFEELAGHAVLTVLADHRKSGRLSLRESGGTGALHLEGGQVVAASCDVWRGEEAVAAIAARTAGEFVWDGNAVLMAPPSDDFALASVLDRLRKTTKAG